MKPKFVVYDLKDDPNVERFIKLAKKQGYYYQRDHLQDFFPFKEGVIFASNGGPIQAALNSSMLYVCSDFEGKMWKLDDLAKDFKLEESH